MIHEDKLVSRCDAVKFISNGTGCNERRKKFQGASFVSTGRFAIEQPASNSVNLF